MTHQQNAPPRASTAGPRKCHWRVGSDIPRSPKKIAAQQTEKNRIQAGHPVSRATATRSQGLTIRIGAFQAHQSHGRSREFSLTADAFDRLLRLAEQLEGRP